MAKSKSKTKVVKKTLPKISLPEWPWNERWSFLIYLGLSLILTLILYSRYLFGPNLFIFNDTGSDTITVFYPNMVHAARYFQEVGYPGWSFYNGLGLNMYPWYILGPFQWPLLPLSPESIVYSIVWMQAGLVFLIGLVFYKFLREAKMSLPVSFIGSLVYTFGGYAVLGSTWYVHVNAIFWMTSTFLGFELLLRRKIWWLFPIPFVFILGTRGYFLILFMIVYGLVRMLDVYGPSLKLILQGYKRMAICGVLAILFALPFIGGQWNKFANSPRVTGNVSYSERLIDKPPFDFATPRHNVTAIMRIFSNDAVGEANTYKGWRNYLEAPALYMGLITLLLVFQFFVLADRRKKWIYGAFLSFWIFLIVFPWFRYAFYGFAGDYYKGALSLFIPFSFLFVGLMGFQEMITQKRLNKWVLFISSIFWLGLLWYPYDRPDVTISTGVQMKASIFIIGYTFLLWLWSEGMLRRIMYPLFIFIVSVEALIMAWPAINHRDPLLKSDIQNKKFHFDDSGPAVQRIKELDKDLFYRIDKVYGSIKTGYNDGMVQGFYGSKVYQSHNHKYYVDFLDKTGVIDGSKEANTRWLVGLSATNIFHGLFSIKYLLSNESSQSKVDDAIYTPIDTIGQTVISRNNYYIPFGIPIESYITPEDFKNISVNERRRSLYFSVLADEDDTWKSRLKPFPAKDFSYFGTTLKDRTRELAGRAMKMEYFSQNRIIGSIQLQEPSMMFFSLPYDQGWKATIDGELKKLELVNLGFTGLLLEPGDHVIELHYEPPLAKWGWFGVLASAIGVLLLIRFKKLM